MPPDDDFTKILKAEERNITHVKYPGGKVASPVANGR